MILLWAQFLGCGEPTGRWLRIKTVITRDTSGEERVDTSLRKSLQVYTKDGFQWIKWGDNCWRLEHEDGDFKTTVLGDTVLVLAVDSLPPCGKLLKKKKMVAEKFYWANKFGQRKEWKPPEEFAKPFPVFEKEGSYYIPYDGYCWLCVEVEKGVYEVQFPGDTVGVFRLK